MNLHRQEGSRLLQRIERSRRDRDSGRLHFLTLARLLQRGCDEDGSAVLEFVAIAIPLFIPLVLYLGVLNHTIQATMQLHNLSRQAARAYVTSDSQNLAFARAQQIIDISQASNKELHNLGPISISLQCESSPCLQPDRNVTLTLTASAVGLQASSTQVVDAW